MSQRISVTLPDDLHELLATEAAQRRQSLATIVRDALVTYYADQLKQIEQQHPTHKKTNHKVKTQ